MIPQDKQISRKKRYVFRARLRRFPALFMPIENITNLLKDEKNYGILSENNVKYKNAIKSLWLLLLCILTEEEPVDE